MGNILLATVYTNSQTSEEFLTTIKNILVEKNTKHSILQYFDESQTLIVENAINNWFIDQNRKISRWPFVVIQYNNGKLELLEGEKFLIKNIFKYL